MNISKIIETFLIKLYHSQKEKNAKLAMLVSLGVLALWTVLSSVLSMPEVLLMLPVWSIKYLKIALDILALGKLIVTGAKTTLDMQAIEAPQNHSYQVPTPATHSEQEVVDYIKDTTEAPAPGPKYTKNMITDTITYPVNKP